jgi:hypothetical protein
MSLCTHCRGGATTREEVVSERVELAIGLGHRGLISSIELDGPQRRSSYAHAGTLYELGNKSLTTDHQPRSQRLLELYTSRVRSGR